MFTRRISKHLEAIQDRYRAFTLIGPRQSGKTTLARHFFSKYEYYSLEDPETRHRAEIGLVPRLVEIRQLSDAFIGYPAT